MPCKLKKLLVVFSILNNFVGNYFPKYPTSLEISLTDVQNAQGEPPKLYQKIRKKNHRILSPFGPFEYEYMSHSICSNSYLWQRMLPVIGRIQLKKL